MCFITGDLWEPGCGAVGMVKEERGESKECEHLRVWAGFPHLSTRGRCLFPEGGGGLGQAQGRRASVLQVVHRGRLWYSPHRCTIWKEKGEVRTKAEGMGVGGYVMSVAVVLCVWLWFCVCVFVYVYE